MKTYKSLRDSLLEYAVFNFSEVFSKFKDPSGSCDTILPPFLFEDVISKSNEMYWTIPDLMECLPCWKALRWEYNNLKLRNTDFNSASLSTINRTIKHISVENDCIDDSIIEKIGVFGSTLLSLELEGQTFHVTRFSSEEFPKLKKLVVRNTLLLYTCLPKNRLQIPDTLEELKIENLVINKSLMDSIECLPNLTTLSFCCCHTFPRKAYSFVQKLGSLRQLRTLNLIEMDLTNCMEFFSGKLKELTNLENLDISYCESYRIRRSDRLTTLQSTDLGWIWNARKLKKLGLYGCIRLFDDNVDYKSLADQVFGMCVNRLPVLEDLLNNTEYYTKEYFISEKFWYNHLLVHQHLLPDEQTPRIEKVVLEGFSNGFTERTSFTNLLSYMKSKRCTLEFKKSIVNIMLSKGMDNRNMAFCWPSGNETGELESVLIDILLFLLDFIRMDLNRSVIKKLMRAISSRYAMAMFPILELCKNAIKLNLFDAEIRKIMSEVLVTAFKDVNIW